MLIPIGIKPELLALIKKTQQGNYYKCTTVTHKDKKKLHLASSNAKDLK
jgi:hypothetical protein